jgi:hypothetical protein
MKGIIRKFIMTTITLAILHTGYCCMCVAASDNVQTPPPKVPDMRLPNDIERTLKEKQAQAQPTPTAAQPQHGTQTALTPQQPQPVIQQPSAPAQMEQRLPAPQGSQGAQGGGFMSAFFNMLTALAKVVLLILAIGGVYLAYNKLKSRMMHVAAPKPSGKKGAPATVSEAVASYAKHRLRKSY